MNEITCEIYESRRMLKWSWRIRFIAANGLKLGHQYNNLADALNAATLIRDAPMRLRVIHQDGTTEEHGLTW